MFQPVAWQGLAIVLLGLAFSASVFVAMDRTSNSVSDTLYGLLPFLVPTWTLVYGVASMTSREG